MSYSVIYKRFRVILDNSKFNEILRKSPYMNMDISSKKLKDAKFVLQKILVHFRENVFSVKDLIRRK
jgi:hypothetical protein